jgi:hypothetical protein
VAGVLAVPIILETVLSDIREAEGVVKFPIGEEACIGSDGSSKER